MPTVHAIEITNGQNAAAMLLVKIMNTADKLHGWPKPVEIGGLYP
jgi:hypothetical protein